MFPRAMDYVKAVQHPERVFTTADLRGAQIGRSPLTGQPLFAAGANAVVVKAVVDGEEHALRFFTREDVSSRERYSSLNDYFTARGLTDCVAMSRWQDDAIEINGQAWPMLRMQWVEGRILDEYVDFLVESGDTRALAGLAERWRELIGRMQESEFAHGDLQHANVMIQQDGTLRLVDLDGAWITPIADGPPPNESGHPNYNRSGRVWGRWMDTFPGLVVYTSLLALSRDTQPWRVLYDEDNLLFRKTDFAPPHETPAWQHVASIRDGRVDAVTAQLKACCSPEWSADRTLEALLGSVQVPWWEKTARTARGSASEADASTNGATTDLPSPPKAGERQRPTPPPVPPTPPDTSTNRADQPRTQPGAPPPPVPLTPTSSGPTRPQSLSLDPQLRRQLAIVAACAVIIGFVVGLLAGVVVWIVTSAVVAVIGLLVVLLRKPGAGG